MDDNEQHTVHAPIGRWDGEKFGASVDLTRSAVAVRGSINSVIVSVSGFSDCTLLRPSRVVLEYSMCFCEVYWRSDVSEVSSVTVEHRSLSAVATTWLIFCF